MSDLPDPLDQDVWSRACLAIQDAARAADAYLSTNRWVPRQKRTRVSTFKSGWPDFSTPLFPADDDPVDYPSLFAEEVGELKPLAFRDAPALAEFIEYIEQRGDIGSRFRLALAEPDLATRLLRMEAAHLPLSILGRSRALGDESESSLRRLYRERETEWLCDPLPVEYWVPLVMTNIQLHGSLQIDNVARIEELTPEMQEARAPREYSGGAVPGPVAGAATHALVVGPYEIANPGPVPRLFLYREEAVPFDAIDHYFEALRVASRARTGYAQVLRRPLGWADNWQAGLPPMTQVAMVRRYPELFDDAGWLNTTTPVSESELADLSQISKALTRASPRTRLAVRRLSLTDLRTREDDRTVDACIGIEALVGEGRDELTHRMSLRAATALSARAGTPLDAAEVYQLMKDIYKHRSALVHGSDSEKGRIIEFRGIELPTADLAEELLRILIQEFLLRPEPWTTTSLDAYLLQTLSATHKATTP